MTASLHENLSRSHEVEGSSERGFGFTVGVILLLIAGGRTWLNDGYGDLEVVLAAVGLGLIVFAAVAPRMLAPLNWAWTKLGLVLFKVVNPIVLGLIFLSTIVPIGLAMRAAGRDLLCLKRDPSAPSYWVERDPPGPPAASMTEQF